ncbi:MAG TPA: hypothetical protein VKX17_12160 [Planctomycetota bacterium]|nr:hypothetical protein [Planctomycetota bacterium]
MARRRYKRRGANAILVAGLFATFCAALFTGMFFLYGKLGRTWRGVAEMRVLFAQVKSLRAGAPIRYDGMELGRVKDVRVVHADAALLKDLPPFKKHDLLNLPLSEPEREKLNRVPDEEVDASARKTIDGRVMVLATLDVLLEQDERRFRDDDTYFVAASSLGDSSVEMVTGSGKPIVPQPGMIVLGVNADLISDIGKNMAQIQDAMESIADIIGGEANKGMVQTQIRNFEGFTGTVDAQVASIEKKVPEVWDGIDTRAKQSEENMNDIVNKILALRPDIDKAMSRTNDAILSMRKSLSASADSGVENLRNYRKEAKEQIELWHKTSQEYRANTPEQLKELRKAAEGALSAADKIDAMLARVESQMDIGDQGARAALNQQTDAAMGFQEVAWQFRKSPVYFSTKYPLAQLGQRHLAWRYDMARSQYIELRRELAALQAGISVADPADRERARHIEQLLAESDDFFSVNRNNFQPLTDVGGSGEPLQRGAKP